MCVLVIGVDVHPQHRLLVAANRDELYARAATTPAVEVWGDRRVLAPRDLQAGGTWEGVSESGLIVVITNRPDGDYDPERASRGVLCREALEQPTASAVHEWIEAAVRKRRFNSFNLFYGDADNALISSWNGDLRTQALDSGTHVLSNLHALGELDVAELHVLPTDFEAVRLRFVAVLASHTTRDARGFRICKHGERYGTVSSSLFYATQDGTAVLEHAQGAPCGTPYERFALEPA